MALFDIHIQVTILLGPLGCKRYKIKLIMFRQCSQWTREDDMTILMWPYKPLQCTILIFSTYECIVGINVLILLDLKNDRGNSPDCENPHIKKC